MTIPLPAPSTAHLTTPELAQELGIDRSPSTLVQIDAGALSTITGHILRSEKFCGYERYRWDNPMFWYPEGTPAERSQYFAIGNAINFRFWRLIKSEIVPASGILDGQRLTGAMYMWRCLRRCLDNSRIPILQASVLSQISEEQFNEIFTDDAGTNHLIVAREDRLANLRDLGHRLERDWNGSFYNLIEATGGSLIEFVRLSGLFRAFDDPLFKLTMVNAILHLGSGIVEFDADPLPAIDYHLLKQLLRQGILVPHKSIAKKIEKQLPLSKNEGYELRRTALSAFIEISRQTGFSGEILDNNWWWNRNACRTDHPACLNPEATECLFLGTCARLTRFSMPLEETRYY